MKLSDFSLLDVKKEVKKKDNRGVPQHSHISFSKSYYEFQSSNQLSYGKNPNYVECFWLKFRVKMGYILKVAGENNPSNFGPENGRICFLSNFDIEVQTRPPKEVQHDYCTAVNFKIY